jgi:HKD family nuclease
VTVDSIEFISNGAGKIGNHAVAVVDALADAEAIVLCAAYWKPNGIKLIKRQLRAALERGVPVDIYASMDEYNTEPEALSDLLVLVSPYPNAKLHLCEKKVERRVGGKVEKRGPIFHTKVYYFRSARTFTAIIGSANLTKGGLVENEEVSVKVTGAFDTTFHNSLLAYLKGLENDRMVQDATTEAIEKYRQEYDKVNGRRNRRRWGAN